MESFGERKKEGKKKKLICHITDLMSISSYSDQLEIMGNSHCWEVKCLMGLQRKGVLPCLAGLTTSDTRNGITSFEGLWPAWEHS